MAYWKLEIIDKIDPTLDDLGHISELILGGYTEGELNDDIEGDACPVCGACPMTVNCNNADCDR